MFWRDARNYQILFLGTFLSLGIFTRDWTIRPDLIAVITLTCLLTQMALNILFNRNKLDKNQKKIDSLIFFNSWRSALITGLGLCLLLRANSYTTMALAASLAMASKFIFRVQDKHFFNPANFGIIAALTLTQDAWVSPGQWGTDWWYLLLFLGTGGMILKRVGRWETSATFLLVYTLLEAIRNYWLGWSWDVLQHQLMSGSLLLFALFMLTDPRSIPNATMSRLIWAIAIACFSFILQHLFYSSTAIFWALFLLSPLTIFLDNWRNAPRFSWKTNSFKMSPN
ncbi:MAG TPA: Na+-transporting NADH:ubiquinone oxidoreductase, subunit NqrB [Cyanothece sp. UBA12306]|nr:Na+-transporting NADH:ubiquinone oxidoreductase, subunit NqrB [Cyanothece sp. UBA12306]